MERLLNECTRRNIPMFNVKKRKTPSFFIFRFLMYMPSGRSSEASTASAGSSNERVSFPRAEV
ncbi:hypothetical protein PO124_17405 [Bacillus licheniformis]|nr:hypothetical protein [Bacillus licheniformis]